MRYFALATDYDGTLAEHGQVEEATIAALERLRASGRALILVTGRELDDLKTVFTRFDLFERVVAENGALLYRPEQHDEKGDDEEPLGNPPPAELVEALRRKGIKPLSVGRVVVATWEPHETEVLHTIRDLGLERQVIFNKGAVMILPSGVNKATGLEAALRELGLSPHNVVGIGDAENDHAFMLRCECSAAVDNALPALKAEADLVTAGRHGRGVAELIDRLLADDLADLEPRLVRHELPVGTIEGDGDPVRVKPYGQSVLLTGTSGSGKSTQATAFLEELAEQEYQFCVLDPEGDYETFEEAIVLGSARRAPLVDEVIAILERPQQNCAVNLLGVPLEDRPRFFEQLLPAVLELRTRTGHPHWIAIDEAHHLLPAAWVPAKQSIPDRLPGVLLITVHPGEVMRPALGWADLVLAVGPEAQASLQSLAQAAGYSPPATPIPRLEPGEAVAWWPRAGRGPVRFQAARSEAERRRHQRKYAEGELYPDRSFYFRGPEGKLNLRAQNLDTFVMLADGVDDATWDYHLRRGDYSRWFRDVIKDEGLAADAERIERDRSLSPRASRAEMRKAIEERNTAPA